MSLPDGVFPSVALSGGLGTLAVRQGDPRFAGWLVVYRFPYADPTKLMEIARFPLPAGSPCFPNLYVLDGMTWLAYHDGQRQRLRVLETGRDVLDVAGLSNPSAFGAGYFAYTEAVQPYRVHRIDLRTGKADQPRLGVPTGLSRILDDGRVVTIDEDRFALQGATIPSFAGPLAVGEGPDGGVVWAHTSGAKGVLYKGRTSFTPKCAADGDILAITTAGPDVRLFCGTLAALQREPGPINTGKQEEPTVSTPNLIHIVRRVDAAFPHLLLLNTIASVGEFTERAVLALHAEDPGFGLLSKQIGEKQYAGHAIDATIYKPTQQVIDIIGNAGARDDGDPVAVGVVAWSEQPKRPGNNWIPPLPVGGSPVPPAVPPPAPPVDLAPLVARIVALEAAQNKDRGSIEALETLVVPLTQLPLNLAALDEALKGYEVTGKTAVGLGHQHVVKLGITKRKS
jgi:hypothetical protein